VVVVVGGGGGGPTTKFLVITGGQIGQPAGMDGRLLIHRKWHVDVVSQVAAGGQGLTCHQPGWSADIIQKGMSSLMQAGHLGARRCA
jgi:hypothetical protein